MGFTVTVELDHPVDRVFAYLADPANRPQWQSSLRRIEPVGEGPAGLGTRWYDVTWAGVRPLMEITAWDERVRWAERGRWRGVEVVLDLVFAPVTESRTRVRATTTTRASGPWRVVGWGLDLLGPATARSDLRRAGRAMGRS